MNVKRPILSAALLVTFGCDVPPPEPQTVPTTASSLLGPTVTIDRGSCTTAQLSNDQLTTFRDVVVPAAMALGRTTVNSAAYKQCLRQIIEVGDVSMPHDGKTDGWGPYCPPGNSGCGDVTTRDAHWQRLGADNMVLSTIRLFYSRRAWIDSHSPNNLRITCHPTAGTPFANSVWTDNRAADEPFFVPAAVMVNAVNVQTNGPDRARTNNRSSLAAVFWHEAMHVHGYNHATAGTNTAEIDQIPHTVGACVRDIVERAADLGCPACPNGGQPVTASFQSNSCACAADPARPSTPSITRSWSGLSGPPQVAVDSFDENVIRRNASGSTARLVDGNFSADLGVNTEVHAGGRVFARRNLNGELLRAIDGGRTWVNFGAVDPNSVTMDDVGTIYKRTPTQIQMLRVGSSSWQTIGGTSGVLIAGGDQFFATDPGNGNVWRFSHASNTWSLAGGPGAWFTVDAFGTLYGLAPNKLSIARNVGGNSWEGGFGGSAENIGGSARFYARELNANNLWRRFPNGTWQPVGPCTFYAPGGTSVWCVRQDGANWRIDAYERD
jgi:hypothetical protein